MKIIKATELHFLLIICAACQSNPVPLNETTTSTIIPQATETLAKTAQVSPTTETVKPSLQLLPPSDILPCPRSHPGFYYVFKNTLFQFRECQPASLITEIAPPDVKIEDVLLIADKLFVLSEENLAVWDLPSIRAEVVYTFEEKVDRGYFALPGDTEKVFFHVALKDKSLPLHFRTEVRSYDLAAGTNQLLSTYSQGIKLIGFDASSDLLYLVPFGQDADFREVHAIPIDEDTPSILHAEGVGLAALADDGRWLATASKKFIGLDEPLISILNIYQVLPGQASLFSSYDLLLSNTGVTSLVWSAATDSFLFLIHPTDPYAGETAADFILGSYWHGEDATSTLLSITGEDLAIVSIEPTSGDILLLDRISGPYYFVDIDGKQVFEMDLPYYILFAGWSDQ